MLDGRTDVFNIPYGKGSCADNVIFGNQGVVFISTLMYSMKILTDAAEVVSVDDSEHISEDDLEAHHMGIETEMELAELKKHLLSCETCTNRLKAAADYVENIQRAAHWTARLAKSRLAK